MTFARRPHWAKRALLAPFLANRDREGAGGRSHHPLPHGRGSPNPPVLLTFDDGPHPDYTPAVLDRLRNYGVTAAFFLVGNRVASAPHLPREIAEAGHMIGNHTFSHRRLGWCDTASSLNEVARCQGLLPGATWFRPPFGRLTPGLWRAARRFNLSCVMWSLDSGDWQCRSESDAAACAAQVLELVRPGDVILFHDAHRWIGPILDAVLPALAGRGLLVPQYASTISSPPWAGLPISR